MTDVAPLARAQMPTPSAFMRGRRPTLYSDSLVESRAPLSRPEFEYRLQTITARSEEAQFQRFIHALLEVEVCPNLVPQTGPTGGGDSKVDAETYAVADAIAERWWSGTAREAASEQWAFAISAMADWRKKARQDVDNVLASGRTYQRIHYITNQFVRDKDRAKLENELARRAGNIPVRIFDRTWIVQAVFDHQQWAIAERELSLPAAQATSAGVLGPLDADRARELVQVEAELADPSRFANSPMQLAHAWLTSALLARGLGRAREELDQRFDRAIDAARRGHNARGQRRMLYQKVWTAFWWFDDYAAVIGGFDMIEALLNEQANAWDLAQLTNLYSLLHSAESHGWLPAGAADLQARRQRLSQRLESLAKRRSHRTDAAMARTHLLHLAFLADPHNPQQHADTVKGFQVLLREVERLPDYPVESLCDTITVFTQLPFTVQGIDAIADRAGELVGQRLGAQAQARQLLDRAAHKVEKKAPEEALRLLGRAIGLLHRQPSRELYLEGAWIASQAYCEVGLFWAARAHLLLGLNRSLRSVIEDAEISFDSLNFALRLAWVELAAGRLPLLLEALAYADVMAAALDLSGPSKEAYFGERQDIEARLARAIAEAAPVQADAIAIVPPILADRQLHLAEQVTLALLGHSQQALQDMTGGIDVATIQAMAWPAEAGPIEWNTGSSQTLRTRIVGCEVIAESIATYESHALVMAIFAALEGFAATAFADRLVPSNDRLLITLDDTRHTRSLSVSLDEDECGDPLLRLGFARGTLSSYATTKEFQNKAVEAVGYIIVHACTPGARSNVERMFSQDAVHERAFSLLHAAAMDDSSLRSPCLSALSPTDSSPVALQNEGRFKTVSPPTNEPGMWEAQVRTDEPPASMLEFNHRHTRMVGAINIPLWDRAQWQGVGFTFWPDGVPGMELIFANADAAAKILRGWHRRVADLDADQVLRLAILTDIDRNNRAYYRLGIAPATVGGPDDAAKTLMIASRSKTMMPQETKNLDVFMAAFARHGCFRLGVGTASDGPRMPFAQIKLAPIELTRVEIKAAWQIEAGEMMFGMMLSGADTPFIPDDVSAPDELPVMQMIGAAKQRRGRG